jgi:hypothetical protein
VTLKSQTDTDYVKSLYVMSVDESAKSLTVKFSGAPSGDYTILLSAD